MSACADRELEAIAGVLASPPDGEEVDDEGDEELKEVCSGERDIGSAAWSLQPARNLFPLPASPGQSSSVTSPTSGRLPAALVPGEDAIALSGSRGLVSIRRRRGSRHFSGESPSPAITKKEAAINGWDRPEKPRAASNSDLRRRSSAW